VRLSEIIISVALFAFGLLYWFGARPGDGIRKWEAIAYWAGWVVLAIALVSPLHEAGEEFFSAHMLQHELIMALSAPLLVLGRPLIRYLWAMPMGMRRIVGVFSGPLLALTAPVTAGILHAGAIWIWHYPPLFGATLTSEFVHAAQHLSFFLTGLLFWWSVLHGPVGAAMLNLLITTIYTGVLGALLVFSRTVLYPAYAMRDQQIGGLIMWVPGGVAYLVAALWIASRFV